MKDSIKRRSVIARTLILAGTFFGGLLKDSKGDRFTATGAGSSLRGPIPAFYARRSKFKGYMRGSEYIKKHKRF